MRSQSTHQYLSYEVLHAYGIWEVFKGYCWSSKNSLKIGLKASCCLTQALTDLYYASFKSIHQDLRFEVLHDRVFLQTFCDLDLDLWWPWNDLCVMQSWSTHQDLSYEVLHAYGIWEIFKGHCQMSKNSLKIGFKASCCLTRDESEQSGSKRL